MKIMRAPTAGAPRIDRRARAASVALRGRLTSGAIPLGLAALSFVLAFAQRPARAFADTRIELSADPSLFLHRVSQVWSSTTDLGHIQSGQFVGYLFPMGPYFALMQHLGVPTVVAQRIWIGGLMALAAWGAVRVLDELYDRRRSIAHLSAGLLYAANPYVVVYLTRGTVALLAYAILPWVLWATARGLRRPRSWLAPAAVGLLLGAGGAGVNAAVMFWVALVPVVFVVYDVAVLGGKLRDGWAFLWRAAICFVIVSAWWIVPVAIASTQGPDFLKFTEQPESIFATTSVPESLRLLGLWLVYFGVGYGGHLQPVLPTMHSYLFSKPVLVGTFLVPLAALAGGLRWARGWLYAPLFGLLAFGAVVVMAAGFPDGTPAHNALVSAYYNVPALQILRTTYKAAPLLALSIACLAGPFVGVIAARLRNEGIRVMGTRLPAVSLGALALLGVLWAAPIFRGHGIDRRLAYGSVPADWRAAMADENRTLPQNARGMVLPGEISGAYRWGITGSSVAPAISSRPQLIREIDRYADLRSSQLQTRVDDLMGQGRLVPGQLDPLLHLMGVRQVLVAADVDRDLTGSTDPTLIGQGLGGQPTFARPAQSYGPVRPHVPTPGHGGPVQDLPDLRRYAVPPDASGGIVKLLPAAQPTVLDGDADGVTELAADGGLTGDRALVYAGDLSRRRAREMVGAGAQLVFSDTNRRRVVLPSQLQANVGPTLGANDPIPSDWASYDLFPRLGTAGRTVATYTDLRYLHAPSSPGFAVFPQNRAFAAFDGDTHTSWISDSAKPANRYIELGLAFPRHVDAIQIYPESDLSGVTRSVSVSVNGGPETPVLLHHGWNKVRIHARLLDTLRIRIATVLTGGPFPGLGGISEVRMPGVTPHESLRLPSDLAGNVRGLDLSRNPFDVLLSRSTADFPYRAGSVVSDPESADTLDMVDAEPGIERDVTLPAARTFAVRGWASVAPEARDSAIDDLVGMPRGWRFDSSSRFEGLPVSRASSAFDSDPGTAWIGDVSFTRSTWLSWRAPRTVHVDHVRLLPGPAGYRLPSVVQVETPAGAMRKVRVAPNGLVVLPQPLRTRSMRIVVARTRQPHSRDNQKRYLRAVAISEVQVPGLKTPRPRRSGTFTTGCGELAVRTASATATFAVKGSVKDLDSGAPLALEGCGRRSKVALPQGTAHVTAPPGVVMRPDHLALESPPATPSPASSSAGSVGATTMDRGLPRRAMLNVTAPAWLVLGESYSSGWRAWCRTAASGEHSLGSPRPVEGYANGWRVQPGCREVRFAFAPQRPATAAYVLSLVGGALMLLVLVAVRVRRRGRVESPAEMGRLLAGAADPPLVLDWPRAILLSAAIGAVGCLFALRVGVALGLLALILLREGATARRLVVLAALGFAAIPIIYIARAKAAPAGFSFSYPTDRLTAQWVGTIALWCLGAAALLMARSVRRGLSGRR